MVLWHFQYVILFDFLVVEGLQYSFLFVSLSMSLLAMLWKFTSGGALVPQRYGNMNISVEMGGNFRSDFLVKDFRLSLSLLYRVSSRGGLSLNLFHAQSDCRCGMSGQSLPRPFHLFIIQMGAPIGLDCDEDGWPPFSCMLYKFLANSLQADLKPPQVHGV